MVWTEMLAIPIGEDEVKVREVINIHGGHLRTKAGHLALPLFWEDFQDSLMWPGE